MNRVLQIPLTRRSSQIELEFRQAGIKPVAPHQIGMSANIDHPAMIDHHDPICLLHRRQPVGDDDRGPALHQSIERMLHRLLALGMKPSAEAASAAARTSASDASGRP